MQKTVSRSKKYTSRIAKEEAASEKCRIVCERAILKLMRIIEREGDAGGKRLKRSYLEQLINEEMLQMRITAFCSDIQEKEIHREKEMPAAKAARQIINRNSIVSQVI